MKRLLYPVTVLLLALIVTGCSKKHEGIIDESDISMLAKKRTVSLNDGTIKLRAWYTDPVKPRHGKPFTLYTYWEFAKPLDDRYQMFFHFEDSTGEERFVLDRKFLDGAVKMSEVATGKLIRDTAEIPAVPKTFNTDTMHIYTGFFSGDTRTVPEQSANDGEDRLKLATVKIDEPNILQKTMKAMAIAGTSRGKIKIDGKLQESFWKNASRGEKFWLSSGEKMAPVKTAVMTALDDTYLYVAFEAEDADVTAKLKKDDAPIYNSDDVVEVFIDGDGDREEYFEMQVSAGGVKFDSSFNGRRKNRNDDWDSGMKYAVQVDGTLNNPKDRDSGWTAELAIPYKAVSDAPNIPPADGDVWKVFFYRINRYSDKKSSGADFMAWTPPYAGDFHNIRFMGDLLFSYERIK